MSTASERLEELKVFKQNLLEQFSTMKTEVAAAMVLDKIRLDDEALNRPKLHNRWLAQLSEEAYLYKKIQNNQKRLELERTRYYLGTQTDQYYAAYGNPHIKILKTDLSKYMDADEFMIEMGEIVELQSIVVDFLEKTLREIGNRGFDITNAINWRKFEAGGN